ncbi:DUF262 domain-containing protein [Sphingomonas sp. CFBP 13603]|uniref:GmrSD restriction endonuclease domain-containing protein n=1 Tax=Sphingomonas sp. CFBP 13603 TaxID=2774040 RepID=UPI0018661F5F|nr:DUF262 domain-containing protein [Sphingomonas sp. CFBP 13603]
MSDDVDLDFNDLEEETNDDLAFWSNRQKELVTAQADYNLGTLRDLADENTIDMKPHFQRRFRWDEKKKSKLIESLLLNVPIPPIYLNEDRYGRYSVIDGKQRISAIQDFFNNAMPLQNLQVFFELNGLYFRDLPRDLQTILRTRPTLRAIIVLRQSDPAIKYEVFQRLNTGGVPLNAQEIRNNIFAGDLNSAINKAGESDRFYRVMGVAKKSDSKIYQEMRDSELVLRYLTFSKTWADFKGGVKRQLDSFMEKNRNSKPDKVKILIDDFYLTVSKVSAVFGENCFQRWQPDKQSWRNHVLASLYDAQMLALQDYDISDLELHKVTIVEKFKLLFTEPEFQRSVDAATNTPSYLKSRVARLKNLLDEVIDDRRP